MKRVLFVCTGNICRSPTADGILRALVKKAGAEKEIEVDSAGTLDYHEGESPDPRTVEAAKARGFDLSSLVARQIRDEDYSQFDLLVAMDASHFEHMIHQCPRDLKNKIRMFSDFSKSFKDQGVPDPYFGGKDGFEKVLDMVEEGCEGLLEELLK